MARTLRRWFFAVILFSLGPPFLWMVNEQHDSRGRPDRNYVIAVDIGNSNNFRNRTTTFTPEHKMSTANSTSSTKHVVTLATTSGNRTVKGLNATTVIGSRTASVQDLRTTTVHTDPCRKRFVNESAKIPVTHDPTKKRIIFMDGVGRLGNKMFQYAALLGLAKFHGFKPLVYRKDLIVNVFQISHVSDTKFTNLPVYFEKAAAVYDPCLETMSHDWDWRLGGYYQSWRYFSNVEDEVRKEFTFKEQTRKHVNKTLHEIEAMFKGRPKVGVHVRRGDMKVASSLKKGYTIANKDYFVRAMDYFRKAVKRPVFVVVSDDINWCKRQLVNNKDVMFLNGNRESDLAILSSCDHSIISTGSYGWWGAWLAGGKTVYYKNFPGNGSWLATQYKADDYFPPSWIGME